MGRQQTRRCCGKGHGEEKKNVGRARGGSHNWPKGKTDETSIVTQRSTNRAALWHELLQERHAWPERGERSRKMCRVHELRASLSSVPVPQRNDCTFPVQPGLQGKVPICLAELMKQSQTVLTEGSHPAKRTTSKASELMRKVLRLVVRSSGGRNSRWNIIRGSARNRARNIRFDARRSSTGALKRR